MKNRDIFLLVLLSVAMLITAGVTYRWSTTMNDDIYSNALEQQLYQKVTDGTVEVPKEKWLAYLKANIEHHQSLQELNHTNKSATASLAQLLAIFAVVQGALVFGIYRRSCKSA